MMKHALRTLLAFVFCLAALFPISVEAQQHRATRLGNPATRFAPPLYTQEDLRSRFADAKLRPDIASILSQWGWKGNLEDLYRAASTADITEVKLPVGTRMPFMSSRENGKPIILRDTLWEGKEPISAYAFTFSSKGRRYRCVTPKPCSNFYLEDLGSAVPTLQLAIDSPVNATICAPFIIRIIVRNNGSIIAPQVQAVAVLPAGLKLKDNQSTLNIEAGTLQAGDSRIFPFEVVASSKGNYTLRAQAVSAEGGHVKTISDVVVRAPVISLECNTPAEVPVGRPVILCLNVHNLGDGTEPKSVITLPFPTGSIITAATKGGAVSPDRITWEISDVDPKASLQFCATFTMRQPGPLSFSPSVQSECSPAVQAEGVTRVIGIPAILLETADLEDPIEVGKEETYVIHVTNQGSADLTNIRLVCVLPASQEFISGTGPTRVSVIDHTITMDQLPNLKPKEVATWRVVVKALKVDDVRFKVEVRTDQFERPIPKEEATQQY